MIREKQTHIRVFTKDRNLISSYMMRHNFRSHAIALRILLNKIKRRKR